MTKNLVLDQNRELGKYSLYKYNQIFIFKNLENKF